MKLNYVRKSCRRRLSRAAHAERCHWSERCNNNVGVTAERANHNGSNARGVTAGKVGRNSSIYKKTFMSLYKHLIVSYGIDLYMNFCETPVSSSSYYIPCVPLVSVSPCTSWFQAVRRRCRHS